MAPTGSVSLRKNDGTLIETISTAGGTLYVTSTGCTIPIYTGSTYTYTYSGTKTFLGLSLTQGASTADYGPNSSYSIPDSNVTLYVVDAIVSVTYKHMTDPNGNKIQVDSAIRDGTGRKIDTNYQLKHIATTATLTTNGWSSNAQTVSVTDVTADNTVIVSPAPASVSDYSSAGIYCSAQASGTLTFTCTTTPTTNITVNVIMLN